MQLNDATLKIIALEEQRNDLVRKLLASDEINVNLQSQLKVKSEQHEQDAKYIAEVEAAKKDFHSRYSQSDVFNKTLSTQVLWALQIKLFTIASQCYRFRSY